MRHVSKKQAQSSLILSAICTIVGILALVGVSVTVVMNGGGIAPIMIAEGLVLIACTVTTILSVRAFRSLTAWYDNILDTIPFPVSVTDANRKWTFINGAVEKMLNVKRADVMGKDCSSWGAAICDTPNCGVSCLRRGQLATTFEQMGLDFKVDVAYLKDEKGRQAGHVEIVQDISQMVSTQKAQTKLVDQISELCESFVSASGNISSGAQALAQASVQQTASVGEVSDMIGEMSELTEANTQRARAAAELSESIKVAAEKGQSQMNQMNHAVQEISGASREINNVIKVIEDIAFQTNILALNASVEAARAGQHGKGFAVVADEVRNLAAKSDAAAKETTALISNTMERSEAGVKIAEDTTASLLEIVNGVLESSKLIDGISESSKEQNRGIDQINTAMEQVSSVVQQNSATAEESAAASEEMSSQANMLRGLLDTFDAQINGGAARPSGSPGETGMSL